MTSQTAPAAAVQQESIERLRDLVAGSDPLLDRAIVAVERFLPRLDNVVQLALALRQQAASEAFDRGSVYAAIVKSRAEVERQIVSLAAGLAEGLRSARVTGTVAGVLATTAPDTQVQELIEALTASAREITS